MSWNPGTLAELVITPTDASKPPEIRELHDVGSVDELIDRARAESRTGTPREVAAVIDGLPVARFAGAWIWEGEPT